MAIDRTILCDDFPEGLPSDARLVYHQELIQQNVRLVRDNVRYKVAVYYSASLRKTFRGQLPASYQGQFGSDLSALLSMLHHGCDVTQSKLARLMKVCDISISRGTISRLLHQHSDWAQAEQQAILRTGLHYSPYLQTDSTKNVERGVRKTTHILCGAYFSVFYTLSSKARIDVLRALQGNPAEGLGFAYTSQTKAWLETWRVSKDDRALLATEFAAGNRHTLAEFETRIQQNIPSLYAKPNIYVRVRDAFALGYYHQQSVIAVADVLLTDDAPEYKKIARKRHALCWVHDARPYNKLRPLFALHKAKLNDFKQDYWRLYDQLLAFKTLPPQQQKQRITQLEKDFDKLFTRKTEYHALDQLIEHTYRKKDKLLAVLDEPALPLHNNAAELGARRIVRKRDISLHTWSSKGTQVRDAFLSIIETADKVGVNPLRYIADRVAKKYQMIPLEQSVRNAYLKRAETTPF